MSLEEIFGMPKDIAPENGGAKVSRRAVERRPGIAELHLSAKGKRAFVTGGSGFLGRAICEEFAACGAKVIAPAHQDMDLLNVHNMNEWVSNSLEYFIHAAATCGGIGLNQREPARLMLSNSLMAANVFQFAPAGCKLVLVGSVCSYPRDCAVPFKESDLWNGYPEETNAAYGIAKRAMITMAQAYRQQYGLNAITLIPTNLYGPGDHFEEDRSHVIPAMIKKFVEARDNGAKSVTLWGTGKATRDFLNVKDAARAIVDAAEHYDSPEPMNLGSGREVSIETLAEMIRSRVGFYGHIEWDREKPDGQPRRCLDISRAREAIGFEPTVSLEDGLRETIEWYERQKVMC